MPAQVGENIHHDSVVAIQLQPCASNGYCTTVSELHVVCSLVLCNYALWETSRVEECQESAAVHFLFSIQILMQGNKVCIWVL